ncbi:ABC transporter substrate-binding protein [Streptomyces goshikiensis]|uniref:ABC transporter substrate-binding protein n=1 Tax=Streptomyces goshikiensis TaxID=1942 RepID=UPI003723E108
MRVQVHRRYLAAAAVTLTGCLAITGCGDSPDPAPRPSSSTPAVDPALAHLVPESLRAKGRITVATDASYAPMSFKDTEGRVVGVDVDLGKAIAAKLGLKAQFQDAKFDGILAGVLAGKYDLAISDLVVTKERQKVVDMVTYLASGQAIAVKAGNPDSVDPQLLCGVRVAVQSATVAAEEIKNDRNPRCKSAGKEPIPGDGDKFDLQTQVTAAVTAGRASAMIADSLVVDYAVKQSGGRLERLGQPYNHAPTGIAVPKGDGELTRAVQRAVQSIINDGTYAQILDRWGVGSSAVKEAVINGAPD